MTGTLWLDIVLVLVIIGMVIRIVWEFYIASTKDRIAYVCIAAFILAAYIIITLTYRPSEFKPYW